ncbi:hypothetical protein E2C01_046472 [Portunus trituberculatus]|uniref:Uncharacterized protein n=1 Tax=Portunus trituberculatus TaxID=210409 RepID=A0A5B7FY00_PORTR|nr:hypothetical protein [Portunus trituberculatus]
MPAAPRPVRRCEVLWLILADCVAIVTLSLASLLLLPPAPSLRPDAPALAALTPLLFVSP